MMRMPLMTNIGMLALTRMTRIMLTTTAHTVTLLRLLPIRRRHMMMLLRMAMMTRMAIAKMMITIMTMVLIKVTMVWNMRTNVRMMVGNHMAMLLSMGIVAAGLSKFVQTSES